MEQIIQIGVFLGLLVFVGYLTYRNVVKSGARGEGTKDYFLANGGLNWVLIAGSITLTNISTDQLVGMNGNQMFLLAWWELASVFGLIILAKYFIPIYYKYNCTTVTELLEKKYGAKSIRTTISLLFLAGNILIYLPILLYGGSLFMKTMFGTDISIFTIALIFALVGAAYSIFGGLRAVAASDTYTGIGLFFMCLLITYLALNAINFDFSGIPKERLTLVGDSNSPIPWPTLFTGMVFIQIYHWSFNQTITQRALAAPSIREARKGVMAAAAIRLLVTPIMVTIPGICAYKLYGEMGDATFGHLVGDLLPFWLSGAFAAIMASAVLTSVNSVINSSATLYVCDIHQRYINKTPNVKKLNLWFSLGIVCISMMLVPVYNGSVSIINLVQQLNGLLSMPILSAFIVCLLFKNVSAKAGIFCVVFGVALYGVFTFLWTPLHYIHLMFITVWCCVIASLIVNKYVFKKNAVFVFSNKNMQAVEQKN